MGKEKGKVTFTDYMFLNNVHDCVLELHLGVKRLDTVIVKIVFVPVNRQQLYESADANCYSSRLEPTMCFCLLDVNM